jgi:hypothetical protein
MVKREELNKKENAQTQNEEDDWTKIEDIVERRRVRHRITSRRYRPRVCNCGVLILLQCGPAD